MERASPEEQALALADVLRELGRPLELLSRFVEAPQLFEELPTRGWQERIAHERRLVA